ncbi:hypothetical protein KM031_10225 [Gemmobacter fulvus]|uniref:LacI family transcriptional regulator n=1 Tax=Gemmobacter fulvus TaxID=2840474 RepID=A0A975P6G2_9RHOB|nr:hypothetical protein [Gemmobacter fulvus]MBT9245927.1 hypothetical protein [Gemmobacter fulvus]QWK89246.1 hypothetical protein KM031_10225 [Gemmobacter fulvus]
MTCARPIPDTITVHVAFRIVRRGGRKEIQLPPDIPPKHKADNALVKALARAFRWRNLIESGAYGTIDEIATAERINPSYVSRVLRMTLLAPDIIESIVDGRQPDSLTLARAMQAFPVGWAGQRVDFCGP